MTKDQKNFAIALGKSFAILLTPTSALAKSIAHFMTDLKQKEAFLNVVAQSRRDHEELLRNQ